MISYDPLWKLLIDEKLKKLDLCKLTGISTSTLAKMSKSEYVALSVIDKICIALNCQPSDIIEYIPAMTIRTLNGEHLNIENIFSNDFVSQKTKYNSVTEFIEASGIDRFTRRNVLHGVISEELDTFVKNNSDYQDWMNMLFDALKYSNLQVEIEIPTTGNK